MTSDRVTDSERGSASAGFSPNPTELNGRINGECDIKSQCGFSQTWFSCSLVFMQCLVYSWVLFKCSPYLTDWGFDCGDDVYTILVFSSSSTMGLSFIDPLS